MTEIYCEECGALMGETDEDAETTISATCTGCRARGVTSLAVREVDLTDADNGHGPKGV